MELKGVGASAIPFVPLQEYESKIPTVFWVKPKTVGMVQKQLLVTQAIEELPLKNNPFSDLKVNEFLEVVEKVQNYEFSENCKELSGFKSEVKGEELRYLINDLNNVAIFEEVLSFANEISHLKLWQYKIFELMTFFSLWKNEEISLVQRRSYNCENCQVMKAFKDRHCFYLNEKIRIELPEIDTQDDFSGEWSFVEGIERNLTADEFLNKFWVLHEKLYVDKPAFLALLDLQKVDSSQKELCITGVIKDEYIRIFNWALDCKRMSSLPFSGGYTNQPNQLMEAFNAVNSSISEYEKYKLDKIQSKKKK